MSRHHKPHEYLATLSAPVSNFLSAGIRSFSAGTKSLGRESFSDFLPLAYNLGKL
jgi:hypothetical protein